jgi:hypothetical protein
MTPVIVSLYVLFLFAMFQYRYSTIWTFLAAPTIGPLATAAFFAIHPLNPYRNIYSQLEGKQEVLVMTEPSAQRLVSLLASLQARIFVLKVGLLNSLILASVAVVVVLFLPKPIPSAFSAGVLIEFAFLFSMASMALQGNLLLRWAFRNWKGNAR